MLILIISIEPSPRGQAFPRIRRPHALRMLRYHPDDFIEKDGLIFVELENSLCMPINATLEPQAMKLLLNAFNDNLMRDAGYETFEGAPDCIFYKLLSHCWELAMQFSRETLEPRSTARIAALGRLETMSQLIAFLEGLPARFAFALRRNRVRRSDCWLTALLLSGRKFAVRLLDASEGMVPPSPERMAKLP